MKSRSKMTEADRWNLAFRDYPFTTLVMLPAACFPAGGLIYVAVFIDDPRMAKLAWFAWAGLSLLLVAGFVAIWKLEKKGAMSAAAKRRGRKALVWSGGVLAALACLVVFWPDATWALRVKAGAFLCGIFAAWRFLKPHLKE